MQRWIDEENQKERASIAERIRLFGMTREEVEKYHRFGLLPPGITRQEAERYCRSPSPPPLDPDPEEEEKAKVHPVDQKEENKFGPPPTSIMERIQQFGQRFREAFQYATTPSHSEERPVYKFEPPLCE